MALHTDIFRETAIVSALRNVKKTRRFKNVIHSKIYLTYFLSELVMKNTLLKVVPIAAFIVLCSGCASTSSLEEALNIAKQAQQTADEAKQAIAQLTSATQTAQQTADDAKQLAMEAKQSADDALQTAGDAKRLGQEANTKIDRSFKKAMAK